MRESAVPQQSRPGETAGVVDRHEKSLNIVTDRGEFGFSYGWKLIDGDTFVTGQLGDPEEDRQSP
jgi:hypothetical protein